MLREKHSVSKNLLSLEIETAREWGYIPDITGQITEKNWFRLPKETRAALVAHAQIRNLEAQIYAHDAKVEAQMRRGQT